jgi:hypothetical protein
MPGSKKKCLSVTAWPITPAWLTHSSSWQHFCLGNIHCLAPIEKDILHLTGKASSLREHPVAYAMLEFFLILNRLADRLGITPAPSEPLWPRPFHPHDLIRMRKSKKSKESATASMT